MKIKKIYLMIFILLFALGNAKANIPYPIIFVHGLASDYETWGETIGEIQEVTNFQNLRPPIVYHVCLNHDGENETAFFERGDGGRNDVAEVAWTQFAGFNGGDNNVENRLFAINFREEIFRRINNEGNRHNDHDHSNTAAIMKQGYALGMMIDQVLQMTETDKVILVGHSMGGLAIREYLQRTDNGEPDGEHMWWVDQDDEEFGHKVSKVVTIGTPHLGSNMHGIGVDDPMRIPERDDGALEILFRTEARRDLRYSYTLRNENNREISGLYLFGGAENQLIVFDPDEGNEFDDHILGYHNNDINCNGEVDAVIGLNDQIEFDDDDEIVRGTFNGNMPLPDNIWYTWIASDLWWLDGDGAVRYNRQFLHDDGRIMPENSSNQFEISTLHTSEPRDHVNIIKGLDEPNFFDFAYDIPIDWSYTYGLFTPQPRNNFDTDIYVFQAEDRGTGLLQLDMESIEAMDLERWTVSIHTENENAIAWISDRDAENGLLEFNINDEGNYYARFWGRNRQEDWHDHPYRFRISLDFEDQELDPPELSQPEDNAEIAAEDIDFSWEASNGANRYQYQLALDNFNDIRVNEVVGGLGINIGGFPNNGIEFWWRVRAGNDEEWSAWSEIRSFQNGDEVPRPPAPDLTSPNNADFAPGEDIDFEWQASERATNYWLQIAWDSDFENLAYSNAVGDRTEVGLEGFPDNYTEVWWRVAAGNNVGWSGWSESWSFINGEEPEDAPDPPQLGNPEDGDFVPGEDIVIEWQETRWAFSYYLQIALDEDFELLVWDEDIGNWFGVQFEGFPNDNTEFWWRVMASNNLGWSDWSDEWMFTNGEEPDNPPDPPELVQPEDGDRIGGEEIEFEWTEPNLANRYRMELAFDENFEKIAFEDEFGNFTGISLVGFPGDGSEFWWRIKAGNFRGWSDWSNEWNFFNGDGPEDPPDPPQLVSPEDESFVSNEDINFEWQDTEFVSNYHLQVSVDGDFEWLVFDNEVGNRTEVVLQGFPNDNTEFYWRMKAGNVRGWSDWSDEWMFTNGEEPDNPPDPPGLINPEDGSFVAGEEIDFEWTAADLASNYHLQVSIDPGFENMAYDEELRNRTVVPLEGFPNDNTEFYWRVKAGNVRGWSEWSEDWTFTNGEEPDNVPDPPQLVSPENGEFIPGVDIDFEWQASELANVYRVQIAVDDGFENLSFDDNFRNITEVSLEGFPNDNTEFWWRVQAGNVRGWSDWSAAWMFTNGDRNNAPQVIESIDDQEYDEDTGPWVVVDLDEVFSDPDDDELSFYIQEGIDELNLQIDEETHVLTLEPSEDYNGESVVVIVADDGQEQLRMAAAVRFDPAAAGLLSNRTLRSFGQDAAPRRDLDVDDSFTVTILLVNDPPFWMDTPEEVLYIMMEEEMTFELIADDVDENEELVIELSQRGGLPDAAELVDHGDGSATFTWQTTVDDEGEYGPIFSVSDGEETVELAITIVVSELRGQSVHCGEGWTLFSLNISPTEDYYNEDEDRGPSVRRMIEAFVNDDDEQLVLLLKDETGDFCLPEWGYYGIRYWDLQEAYYVKLSADWDPYWVGEPIQANSPIEISEGWNMIPYYPDYDLPADEESEFYAFTSILDNLLIIKNGWGEFIAPRHGFSNMRPCETGMGFQVNVDADVALEYPEPFEGAALIVHRTEKAGGHWTQPASTGENMSVLITSFGDLNVSAVDQVAVFSRSTGLLAGAGSVRSNGICGLAVWGDDQYSEAVDGLTFGGEFILRLWDRNSNTEVELTPVIYRQGASLTYTKDGFLVIDVAGREAEVPGEFMLFQNYPNPFNPSTSLSFTLPSASQVKLSVWDTNGRLVDEILSGQMPAGQHNVNWTAREMPAGIYIFTLKAGDTRLVTKGVLII